MRTNRTLILVDGENLLLRFKSMLDGGAKLLTDGPLYKPDLCVWHREITRHEFMEVIRVSYYTTCVGDSDKMTEVINNISSVQYMFEGFRGDALRKGRLCPHVFKKGKQNIKTKSVDINICIDALRHTYNDSIDNLYLFSGDGDYIPLIQEVMRQGKRVVVGAFSDGLNRHLQTAADDFINLDKWMIRKE